MKNVYEVRRDNKQYKVLASIYSKEVEWNNVAVICNLYYLDSLNRYYKYFDVLPKEIDLYIVSSNNEVLEEVKKRLKRDNIDFIKKDNRGRDISALLVAAKDIVDKYDYLCFLHDKKAYDEKFEKDVDLWIDNLWGNMILSKEYIYNIKELFESDSEIGLLLPPERFGEQFSDWEYAFWSEADFQNVIQLAIRLGLNADLDKNYPAISLGTCFWCKVDALKKLFQDNWTYGDFPQEPLPEDGVINHAVERVLPYVAQDAGYRTEMIMAEVFVPKLLSHIQEYTFYATKLLFDTMDIKTIGELKHREQLKNQVIEKMLHSKMKLYLYGAGEEGNRCYCFFRSLGIEAKAFIVSKENTKNSLNGIPIILVEEMVSELKKNLLVITVKDKLLQQEIEEVLKSYGITNYIKWGR